LAHWLGLRPTGEALRAEEGRASSRFLDTVVTLMDKHLGHAKIAELDCFPVGGKEDVVRLDLNEYVSQCNQQQLQADEFMATASGTPTHVAVDDAVCLQVLEPEDELSEVFSSLLERERRLAPVAIIELHVHEDAAGQVLENEEQGVRTGHGNCLVQVNNLVRFS
jgi:hypothetical protein